MRGLYIHIPFCEHICTYCDFCKRVPKNESMIDAYIHTLSLEYEAIKEVSFDTIYIGGGTPSMLSVSQLTQLFDIFKDQHPIEYTVEVNPESYSHEKGMLFKEYGINRISLGVQTFNETILVLLNRKHTNKDVFSTINSLKELGITNINLDLIFGLPKQTLDDVKKDLEIISSLDIPHLSYYNLILEDNTVLFDQYKKGTYTPSSDELELSMYTHIVAYLSSLGYIHYEVSNFHKGFPSLHNQIYWTNQPYDALGAGAAGFTLNTRYMHSRNITAYIKNPHKTYEVQTEYMNYQDTLIFGLRMLKGVSLQEIKDNFQRSPLNDFPKLYSMIDLGYVEIVDNYLRVTPKGLLFLSQIEVLFI